MSRPHFELALKRLALEPHRLAAFYRSHLYNLYRNLTDEPSATYLAELKASTGPGQIERLEKLVRAFEQLSEADWGSDVSEDQLATLQQSCWVMIRSVAREVISELPQVGSSLNEKKTCSPGRATSQEISPEPFEIQTYFRAVTLLSLMGELREYLSRVSCPGYDAFLFAEDHKLYAALDDFSLHRVVLGWGRKRIPMSLFDEPSTFAPKFEDLRLAGADWMHLKIHGAIDRQMIITIQAPTWQGSTPPEYVPIRLTKCEWKPKWTFK